MTDNPIVGESLTMAGSQRDPQFSR